MLCMHMKSQAVPNPLRVNRMARGWHQADLARRIGCSRALITLIETGRCYPGPDLIPRLATAFEVDPKELAREFEELRLSRETSGSAVAAPA
ncbi:MAG: Helix-turn-helix domain [Phycisphaerales bacterium]|nr:Helix-turn-helix domain [Phycisphaerales bacterium]